MGIINAKFNAEFESIEKTAKKFPQKSYSQKSKLPFCHFLQLFQRIQIQHQFCVFDTNTAFLEFF